MKTTEPAEPAMVPSARERASKFVENLLPIRLGNGVAIFDFKKKMSVLVTQTYRDGIAAERARIIAELAEPGEGLIAAIAEPYALSIEDATDILRAAAEYLKEPSPRSTPPRREPPDPPREHPFVRAVAKFHNVGINAMPPCMIRQWSDQTGCIAKGCGLLWDTNDSDPPLCPRWAVARGRVAVPGYPSSGPSPSPPQAGSRWPLWASLIILAAAIGWVHGADILAWLGL